MEYSTRIEQKTDLYELYWTCICICNGFVHHVLPLVLYIKVTSINALRKGILSSFRVNKVSPEIVRDMKHAALSYKGILDLVAPSLCERFFLGVLNNVNIAILKLLIG